MAANALLALASLFLGIAILTIRSLPVWVGTVVFGSAAAIREGVRFLGSVYTIARLYGEGGTGVDATIVFFGVTAIVFTVPLFANVVVVLLMRHSRVRAFYR